ncbi:unnamed protein product [Oikopleura dioica]|uniref:Glycosyltransferase 2-like domain-containing protein n=1 Tax=Oikopleura dioica TaxID=34765 RepID=E4Y726_OIKDI|nr:unnamed protein product [Oikopleura dioica]
MIERIIQRFVGVFIPGIIGYLFAWSSLNESAIEQHPSFSKNNHLHFENIPAARQEEESSIRRNTRSLLSFPQPSGETCDCKTEFKGNKDLKVNYFGNSFVTAEAYDDVIKRRNHRSALFEVPPSSSRINSKPKIRLEVLPLKRLSIPPIELLPLFDDEKASSDGPSTCRGGRARSAEVVCAVIYAHYGKIELASSAGVRTEEESLTVTVFAESLRQMNEALASITFKSTRYDPKGSTDVITIRYGPHKAQIPLDIKYPKQPLLMDPKSGSIADTVTICVKTFDRYPCLRNLIKSVKEAYPEVRVIVADDSINYEDLDIKGVDQFRMPRGIGFNNGKNLAISQVTTEYFVWVDDDFFFTENTNLEWMREVLETTDLDLVGGKAGASNWGYTSTFDRLSGGSEGDCLYRTFGSYGVLDAFPTCKVADVIQNFYMARTLSIRAIGFDGIFQRISHKEFFLDALGRVKIAFCDNISVGHSHTCFRSQKAADDYKKYREPGDDELQFIDRTWFYRYNVKCIAEKKRLGNNNFFNIPTTPQPTVPGGLR